jgi:hypothetical protein
VPVVAATRCEASHRSALHQVRRGRGTDRPRIRSREATTKSQYRMQASSDILRPITRPIRPARDDRFGDSLQSFLANVRCLLYSPIRH